MFLQRAFETILSALIWLFELLLFRTFVLTVLGLGALVVFLAWRRRNRAGS